MGREVRDAASRVAKPDDASGDVRGGRAHPGSNYVALVTGGIDVVTERGSWHVPHAVDESEDRRRRIDECNRIISEFTTPPVRGDCSAPGDYTTDSMYDELLSSIATESGDPLAVLQGRIQETADEA